MNEGVKLAKLGANLIIEKKRAEGTEGRGERGGEKGNKTARADSQAANCACAVKKERERVCVCMYVCGRGREIFKYLYGSLFRPLINGTEEGRCN